MVTGQHLPWVVKHTWSAVFPQNLSLTCLSMPIMLNKHSHPKTFQLFIWLFQRSKPFTGHCSVVPIVQNMNHLPLPFTLHVRRSMSTTTKLRSLPRASCQWVRSFVLTPSRITNILLVLNPKEKMSYFKKNWPSDLHEDVLKCVEEEVRRSLFFSMLSS